MGSTGSLRSLGLRTVLVASAVVLTTGAVVGVGLVSLDLLRRLAHEHALGRVRLAGGAAAGIVAGTARELAAAARELAERPALAAELRADEPLATEALLSRFDAAPGLDASMVVLGERIVARSEGAPAWIAGAPWARAQRGSTVVEDPGTDALWMLSAAEISGFPGAVALVAKQLDAAYADEVGKRVGLTVQLVSRGEALSGFGDPRAILRGRVFDDPARAQAARSDPAGPFVSIEPLRDSSDVPAALIETALDGDAADEPARHFQRVLVLVTVAVAALAALLASLVAIRIVRPIEALTEASERIGRGDLASVIPRAAGREVGLLSTRMEEMRDRLLGLTAELRRRRAEAEAILTGVAEGVYSVDRERTITWLNPQAAKLLGTTPEAAAGKFCGDVLNPERPDGVRPCDERCPILEARFRGAARAVERLVLADGQRRTVVVTSASPDAGSAGDDGGSLQVQVLRDETEEESARRLRDAVVANVSHEFRTPLAAQLASIEMLRERVHEVGGEGLDDLLRSVERPALRLTQLVDNLLESLRIDAGMDGIRRQPIALDEVVEDAVELTRSLIVQKGQELEMALPWPLPQVSGDAPRLAQVLVNLLANASKFSPTGSSIRIGGTIEADSVSLWVEDDGPGFSEEVGERLFERYRRAPGEEPEESGMGLGLWIVKSIVSRHGGRVEARNTGQGARVTVSLPRGGKR